MPVDRNDWGPRLGFAYQLGQNTVLRGGVGVYYGMSVATNFQYPGTAFRKSATMFFTNDNFNTRAATLADPFHGGVTGPQGETYGKLAEWGYGNGNDLGTTEAQNADVYQWNLGLQHLLPSQIVLAVDYSANRSTHLPFGGYSSTRNRDFVSSARLAKLRTDPNFLAIGGPAIHPILLPLRFRTRFCSLFGGTGCAYNAGPAIFNEPDSQYGNSTLPLANLLRPYPQFDGDFEGFRDWSRTPGTTRCRFDSRSAPLITSASRAVTRFRNSLITPPRAQTRSWEPSIMAILNNWTI